MCLNVQNQGYSHCVMYFFFIYLCVTYFIKCIYMMLSTEQLTFFLLMTGMPKYYEIKGSSSTSRTLAYLDAVGDVHQE